MMLIGSVFGTSLSPVPQISALFNTYPIGANLRIGSDSSFWAGSFGGLQNGVALLTNAQLFANNGQPIDGLRPVVRIPIQGITFVSQ